MSSLQYIDNIELLSIGPTPIAFLQQLARPSVIDVPGFDSSRTRAVSVLIHGNEPSGIIALHHWLTEKHKPACNMRFIISSVPAAIESPYFSHRFLPDDADLNRCFNGNGPAHIQKRAQAITQAIAEVKPEAVVDLHNTSGSGPGFAVSLYPTHQHIELASFFVDSMIITSLRMGALMDQDFQCPVITVECGGSRDTHAHTLAYSGLCEFANAMQIRDSARPSGVSLVYHPLRVELDSSLSVDYAHEPDDSVDLCLIKDIEQYNEGITKAGTLLGWVNDDKVPTFNIRDEFGQQLDIDLFIVRNKMLYNQVDLNLFMATNNPFIAKQDCLFYAVVV